MTIEDCLVLVRGVVQGTGVRSFAQDGSAAVWLTTITSARKSAASAGSMASDSSRIISSRAVMAVCPWGERPRLGRETD